MQRNSRRYQNIIEEIKRKNLDVVERTVSLNEGTVSIYYISQMTNKDALSEQVLKPLMAHSDVQTVDAATAISQWIFAGECKLDTDIHTIEQYILDGMTVMLFSNGPEYSGNQFEKG